MYRVCYIIVVLFFFSCTNVKKRRMLNLLEKWDGREIIYSPDMKFTIQGCDTLNLDFTQYQYKIVTYVDSIGCVSCKLNLQAWVDFISEIDSTYLNDICFQFVFQPYRVNELLLLLKQNKFMLPVCIDRHNQFGKLNNFPKEVEFHTFLLNKQNKVIAIGNPTFSQKMRNFYLKIIQGGGMKSDVDESCITKTDIQVKETVLSLGQFNWQEEQNGVFTIQNIGKRSLVVNNIITSCGCITVEYVKKPVQPDESLSIKVKYKADRPEYFNKTVMVYCNAESAPIELKIRGNAK